MSLVGITSTYPSCYGLSVKHFFFFSKVLAINNTFFVCLYVSVCVCVCVCVCVFSRFFALFLVMFIIALASHAGVFRGACLSSLSTRGRGGIRKEALP